MRALDKVVRGKAKGGLLDGAFFHVLEENIRDAEREEGEEVREGENEGDARVTTRPQILMHIKTRCSEELEALISTTSPGSALLNRLLRCEDKGIRGNLLREFLLPNKVIVGGKEIGEGGAAKVSVDEFVDAVKETVERVRGFEGVTGAKTIEGVVEDVRGVCREARGVIDEGYGRGGGSW